MLINKEELLSLDELYDELDYDGNTGIFRWKLNRSGISKGKRAGGAKQDGSRSISINRKEYYEHRLAWLYIYKKWPDGIIDHINRDNSDNRIENLRISTTKDNGRNRKDTSIYGHNITKRDNRFVIQLQHKNRRYSYSLKNLEDTIKLRDFLINYSKTSVNLPIGTSTAIDLLNKELINAQDLHN